MCDGIFREYHQTMKDEFTMPLAMLASEEETKEMTRKELMEQTMKTEGHAEWTNDFLAAEERDRNDASAEQVGQGGQPLPSFEKWLAEEPSVAECDRIRARCYDYCNAL